MEGLTVHKAGMNSCRIVQVSSWPLLGFVCKSGTAQYYLFRRLTLSNRHKSEMHCKVQCLIH